MVVGLEKALAVHQHHHGSSAGITYPDQVHRNSAIDLWFECPLAQVQLSGANPLSARAKQQKEGFSAMIWRPFEGRRAISPAESERACFHLTAGLTALCPKWRV